MSGLKILALSRGDKAILGENIMDYQERGYVYHINDEYFTKVKVTKGMLRLNDIEAFLFLYLFFV